MSSILVIHGPNLNLLGKREPKLYGQLSLAHLNQQLTQRAKGCPIECYQSNAEHEIVAKIHHATETHVRCLLLNAAALTHTSLVLRDALLATELPFYEIHLTNIYARETFRQKSYLSDIALGVISGLGVQSYYAALAAALEKFFVQPFSTTESYTHGY